MEHSAVGAADLRALVRPADPRSVFSLLWAQSRMRLRTQSVDPFPAGWQRDARILGFGACPDGLSCAS
jgi:hypothetical protein